MKLIERLDGVRTGGGKRAFSILLIFAGAMFFLNSPARADSKFSFGPNKQTGFTHVDFYSPYSADRGYGFEPDVNIPAPGAGPAAPASRPSEKYFVFSLAAPDEGNYRVTATLGDPSSAGLTTVKSESRMLMLEHIATKPGEMVTRSFLVNIHHPVLPDGTKLKIDSREVGVYHWDDKLTLEFMDAHPALASLEIQKVDDATTVFLCGDSTVTNQVREPYGTWGQMLPRWFDDHVAIAVFAESGETVKAFRAEHRWDKVLATMKKGDYVFLQFGHNDLNQHGHNAIWPADDKDGDWVNTYSPAMTDYKNLLVKYATEVQSHDGIPVIVSPMTKINIGTGELNAAGLGDYPKAAVQAASEAKCALVDLNAMSVQLVNALGPAGIKPVYVEGLHSTSWGGYLFSRCIVLGIQNDTLPLAAHLLPDAGKFDPGHPSPLLADFTVPLEPRIGGGGRFGRRGAASGPSTRQQGRP